MVPKRVFLKISFLVVSILPSILLAAPETIIKAKLAEQIRAKGPKTHFIVADLETGRTIFENRAQEKVKPASVLKILTSTVAMSILGSDYRFRTEFWGDSSPGKDGSIGNLYIKGGGDPSFTIEDLLMIIRNLKRQGIKKISKVIYDDFLFEEATRRVGQRAYEAGPSALSFNFNTISFDVCPTEVGRQAVVLPNPSEVPVILSGRILTGSKQKSVYSIDDSGMDTGALGFKLSGQIGKSFGCETVYRSISNPPVYFAQSVVGLMNANGIKVTQGSVHGKVSKNGRRLIYHDSKPLSHIIWDLNHFSTNVIAEQLLYHIGFSNKGGLSREVGIARIGTYLNKLGLQSDDYDIYDGSGLSRENRITATLLLRVLRDVYKNQRIWPEFESSLPVGGKSGTLKKRFKSLKGGIVRAKTGSLNGVASLAGYIITDKGRRYVFVCIANGTSIYKARQLEEDLVKIIVSNQ